MNNNLNINKRSKLAMSALMALMALLVTSQNAFAVETAAANDFPKIVTIQQLLQIVREKSPRYAVAHSQVEAAEAGVVAADVLPNPSVTYGRYDQAAGRLGTQFDGLSQQNVTVTIPVLLAGQHGARKTAAERKVDVSIADAQVNYNQLVRDTWGLFVELLAEQQRVVVLEDAQRELARLKTIISGKEDAGTASRYDVLRITQELQNLQVRLENAQTEITSTVGKIGVLLGFSNWQLEAAGNLVPIGAPAEVNTLWQQVEINNPELESARRETVAADAGLDRAKRERFPIPSLFAGTAFTDKPYGNAVYTGFSVDLPLFDRGQGGMAKASAEKNAALLKRELLLASTQQELERAVTVLARRRDTLSKFERDVLKPLPTLKQMAEDAYRLGKSGLLELLDSSRSRIEIKLSHLDLLTGEIEAELDTMMVSGLLVTTLEQTPR
jgi:cobalt-zinc-cadmium efflux system outer membrane protein